jgi:hypothetical protein
MSRSRRCGKCRSACASSRRQPLGIFPTHVEIRSIALSDRAGTVELHMPVVDGVTVTGCSTVSPTASAT